MGSIDVESSYKAVKEAFHSNNSGTSIISISILSLSALSSYAIYAALISRKPSNVILDYLINILPLLLSVTILSNQPATFNAILLCIFGLLFNPTQRALQEKRYMAGIKGKSKGKWLEESDSDEEPSQSSSNANGTIRPIRNTAPLPSEVIAHTTAFETPESTNNSTFTGDGSPEQSSPRRRKASPAPINVESEGHTSITVLPTPEMKENGTMAKMQQTYPQPSKSKALKDKGGDNRLAFLSVYRAHMMIMTVHCILAVDFPVYPRSLGKCEDFGTSLMDVGVGSFVFSLGIVTVKNFKNTDTFFSSISRNFRKALPILALGLIRVLMVKGVEYPEHVTEYGVHWNFFFTLALVPFLCTFLWPFNFHGASWTLIGVLVTIWHQFFLSFTSLQSITLNPTRSNLILANIEGLTSLPGYLALYLFGLSIGQHIQKVINSPSTPSHIKRGGGDDEEKKRKRRTELLLELIGYSVAFWTILLILRVSGMQVSRRLANLPYVLWVSAYNTTFLLGYLIIENTIISTMALSPSCPALLEAINANGLNVFLLANLLTGLINLSVKTMYTEWYLSMPILLGYSVLLSLIAWTLKGRRLKL